MNEQNFNFQDTYVLFLNAFFEHISIYKLMGWNYFIKPNYLKENFDQNEYLI
jgi:hypothetical protein